LALLRAKYKRPSGEEKKNPNKLKVTVLKQVSKNLLPDKFSENRFFSILHSIGDRYSKSLLNFDVIGLLSYPVTNCPITNYPVTNCPITSWRVN